MLILSNMLDSRSQKRTRRYTRMKINFRERKSGIIYSSWEMKQKKKKNVERIPNTYEFCK